MEKEFIDELTEIIDAAIDEGKVKTVILMTCDSEGNHLKLKYYGKRIY